MKLNNFSILKYMTAEDISIGRKYNYFILLYFKKDIYYKCYVLDIVHKFWSQLSKNFSRNIFIDTMSIKFDETYSKFSIAGMCPVKGVLRVNRIFHIHKLL